MLWEEKQVQKKNNDPRHRFQKVTLLTQESEHNARANYLVKSLISNKGIMSESHEVHLHIYHNVRVKQFRESGL